MLIGRRESCDIVLRFSNVSAHHCQLTVNGGYWHVRDLQSRNGVKVNGVRVTDKRIDPGDMLSVAKHKYEVHYSPVDLGAVGPPPPDVRRRRHVQQVVAGAGGAGAAEVRRQTSARRRSDHDITGRAEAIRYAIIDDASAQIRGRCRKLRELHRMAKKKKIRADFRKNRSVRARTTDWTRQYRQHGFEDEAPLQGERISGKGELARRRTVCGQQPRRRTSPASTSLGRRRAACRRGRVLCVYGLTARSRTRRATSTSAPPAGC